VIGTCSERSSDYVKSLGADHVVDYNKGSISEQVATMTHLTIDCVYDCIGGDNTKEGKYSKRRSEHREWSTVVDISMTPPSSKPISLFLSRSPLSKTPKQVFFNPINIFDIFFTLYYCFIIILFSFNVQNLFLQV